MREELEARLPTTTARGSTTKLLERLKVRDDEIRVGEKVLGKVGDVQASAEPVPRYTELQVKFHRNHIVPLSKESHLFAKQSS